MPQGYIKSFRLTFNCAELNAPESVAIFREFSVIALDMEEYHFSSKSRSALADSSLMISISFGL